MQTSREEKPLSLIHIFSRAGNVAGKEPVAHGDGLPRENVGHHADHAHAAHGKQGDDGGVLAGIDGQAVADQRHGVDQPVKITAGLFNGPVSYTHLDVYKRQQ